MSEKKHYFGLDAEFIMILKQRHNTPCASCNIVMLWKYSDNNARQFTVNRNNSSLGHT